jgi:hypothetical protein
VTQNRCPNSKLPRVIDPLLQLATLSPGLAMTNADILVLSAIAS